MSKLPSLNALVERYLAERGRLGFDLRRSTNILHNFERHVRAVGHRGPLTLEVMADWARRDSHGSSDPHTWARRLKALRTSPFPTGDNALCVAFYASAEMDCFSVLGWTLPDHVLDLYVEFRCLTNGLRLAHGSGLLGALMHFGLPWQQCSHPRAPSCALRSPPTSAASLRPSACSATDALLRLSLRDPRPHHSDTVSNVQVILARRLSSTCMKIQRCRYATSSGYCGTSQSWELRCGRWWRMVDTLRSSWGTATPK